MSNKDYTEVTKGGKGAKRKKENIFYVRGEIW